MLGKHSPPRHRGHGGCTENFKIRAYHPLRHFFVVEARWFLAAGSNDKLKFVGQELELPAATQRFIKLDDRQQFVAPRLGQTQLRIKQFAVGVERLEQV